MKLNKLIKQKLLFYNHYQKKIGDPPGTLSFVGDIKQERIKTCLYEYNKNDFVKKDIGDINELKQTLPKNSVKWINIDGLHNIDHINNIAIKYNIHPVFMEDILNVSAKPKIEILDDIVLVILRMYRFDKTKSEYDNEQISLILGKDFILTFQEREGDVFDPVRSRIETGKGKIRQKGSDYLLFALIDIIVDNYYSIMEPLSDRTDQLEEEILESPSETHSAEIHQIKKEIMILRKNIWPLREILNFLSRKDSEIIDEGNSIYFGDILDHIIQITDYLETIRDVIGGLYEVYTSAISNRMNNVMKILTLVATIFIPLTFIAGIYGMNFKNMPELEWDWGYFMVLGIMFFAAAGMVIYFKIKKWF